jgi:hypothetical protein
MDGDLVGVEGEGESPRIGSRGESIGRRCPQDGDS